MATQGGRNSIDLIARLKAEPYRFRFFQAIRLLKLTEKHGGRKAAIPRKLRFRTPLSLIFLPSEILRFEQRMSRDEKAASLQKPLAEEDLPHEMEVGFMGLTGPSGVLPAHYTELLMDRKLVQRDGSAHAFLDLFNHRAISLFYEAWQKYRFHVSYEMGARDGFTQHLLDLLGTGRPDLQGRGKPPKEKALTPQILAYFAGALGRRPLPSSSLASLVSHYFGVKVALEQFVGQWIEAPLSEQSGLGGTCNALGVSTVLGQRMWDQQTKIRLRIGPLDQAKFSEFQPGRSAAEALRQLVELCVGQTLSCDVTLVLNKDEAPPSVMNSHARIPMRLGINTWARTTPPDKDLDEVQFKLL
jgi:type VI secretion system protein ImpH